MDFEALMGTLGSRDNRSIANERIVNTREGDQVGLELIEIDVERPIEAKRRGNGADNLCDQAVEVLI